RLRRATAEPAPDRGPDVGRRRLSPLRRGLAPGEARLSPLMALWRITVAYDGTDFAGWQAQGETVPSRTVQATLESALGRFSGGPRVVVVGAGRTDTGVHALG